ncbi:SDR family oxidoreductase [Alphaproteobacteria bacterium]|nr:SDR family oxidoreductase [Alphaproteobacteria bacterium]
MNYNFQDKVVLITGASGHLGSAFANAVAMRGASCVLIDRDQSALDMVVNKIARHSSASHFTYFCDFTDRTARAHLNNKILDSHSRLDVIINNAAFTGDSNISGWREDFEYQTLDAWQLALEVNLSSCFELSQKLVPLLMASKGASILNIASIYASIAPDYNLYKNTKMYNPAAYGVSKSGLVQLTKWLASTLAPNIRVNAVSPGGIYRGQDTDFVERYTKKTLLGRMAEENDIVPAMLFLTSDQAKYITGQNLIVDGGYSIV